MSKRKFSLFESNEYSNYFLTFLAYLFFSLILSLNVYSLIRLIFVLYVFIFLKFVNKNKLFVNVFVFVCVCVYSCKLNLYKNLLN